MGFTIKIASMVYRKKRFSVKTDLRGAGEETGMDTYCPYNPNNRLFKETDIHRILHRYGLPHYRVQR